jgi:hypothetical protein
MAKTEKVKYSKTAVLIDGIQLKRVQTVGQSVDLSKEKQLELSNTQVVEYIDNVPNVSVSIDTNDVGSIDTLRLAADHFLWRNGVSSALDPRTGGCRSLIRSTAQNKATAVSESSFLTSKVDIMYAVSEDLTNVARTAWVHNAALTGISWNYDVNGFAQENYTFQSDNRTWYLGRYAAVRGYALRKDQISRNYSATSQAFKLDIGQAAKGTTNRMSGATVVAVGIDDKIIFKSDTSWRITTIGADGSFTLGYQGVTPPYSTPYASTATGAISKVFVLWVPKVATSTWTGDGSSANPGYNLTSVSTSIGGRSREYLSAWLYNTIGPAGKITEAQQSDALRLQSISIDVSPGADPIFQLGSKSAYSYDIEEPLPVSVNVSAIDSDLEQYAKLAGTSIGLANSAKQIRLEDFNGANRLVLRIFKDKAKATVLKAIRLSNMNVTGVNDNVTVGGNATTEFTFECSNISCSAVGTKAS